jgi:hypothetical protein
LFRRLSPVEDIDAQMLAMLARRPFSSVPSIAEALGDRSSKIYVHSVQRLQLVNQYVHEVPCQLSDERGEKQVSQFNGRLSLQGINITSSEAIRTFFDEEMGFS